MKWLSFSLVVMLMNSVLVFATEGRHPPVSKKTLVSNWDAISRRDVRVYRMEIKGQCDSYLSFSGTFTNRVYKLEKMEVKDGEVFLSFVDPKDSRKIIHVRGTGVASWDGIRDEGLIDAQLIINPNKKPLNIWKLEFIKTPHIEVLFELSKSAEEVIRQYERKKGRD